MPEYEDIASRGLTGVFSRRVLNFIMNYFSGECPHRWYQEAPWKNIKQVLHMMGWEFKLILRSWKNDLNLENIADMGKVEKLFF